MQVFYYNNIDYQGALVRYTTDIENVLYYTFQKGQQMEVITRGVQRP